MSVLETSVMQQPSLLSGALLDVKDVYIDVNSKLVEYKWRKGEITQVKSDRVKVRYLKWDARYDEWIAQAETGRFAAYGSRSDENEMAAINCRKREEDFILAMKERGFEIAGVEGDGNCLYRAAAIQVLGFVPRGARK